MAAEITNSKTNRAANSAQEKVNEGEATSLKLPAESRIRDEIARLHGDLSKHLKWNHEECLKSNDRLIDVKYSIATDAIGIFDGIVGFKGGLESQRDAESKHLTELARTIRSFRPDFEKSQALLVTANGLTKSGDTAAANELLAESLALAQKAKTALEANNRWGTDFAEDMANVNIKLIHASTVADRSAIGVDVGANIATLALPGLGTTGLLTGRMLLRAGTSYLVRAGERISFAAIVKAVLSTSLGTSLVSLVRNSVEAVENVFSGYMTSKEAAISGATKLGLDTKEGIVYSISAVPGAVAFGRVLKATKSLAWASSASGATIAGTAGGEHVAEKVIAISGPVDKDALAAEWTIGTGLGAITGLIGAQSSLVRSAITNGLGRIGLLIAEMAAVFGVGEGALHLRKRVASSEEEREQLGGFRAHAQEFGSAVFGTGIGEVVGGGHSSKKSILDTPPSAIERGNRSFWNEPKSLAEISIAANRYGVDPNLLHSMLVDYSVRFGFPEDQTIALTIAAIKIGENQYVDSPDVISPPTQFGDGRPLESGLDPSANISLGEQKYVDGTVLHSPANPREVRSPHLGSPLEDGTIRQDTIRASGSGEQDGDNVNPRSGPSSKRAAFSPDEVPDKMDRPMSVQIGRGSRSVPLHGDEIVSPPGSSKPKPSDLALKPSTTHLAVGLIGQAANDLGITARLNPPIGSGTSADVHIGFNRQGEAVAIKTYARGLAEGDVSLSDIAVEQMIGTRLRHPSLVRVLSGRVADHQSFTALSIPHKIELRTARDLIREQTSLRTSGGKLEAQHVEKWLEVAFDISTAIEHLHRSGVVHGDIKPDNIVLNPTGPAVLIDFASARVAVNSPVWTREWKQRYEDLIVNNPRLSGRPVGRDCPEGGEAHAEGDVYLFGNALIEFFTGNHRNLADVRGVVPDEVFAVIERSVDPNPETRPKISEIREVLGKYAASSAQKVEISKFDLEARAPRLPWRDPRLDEFREALVAGDFSRAEKIRGGAGNARGVEFNIFELTRVAEEEAMPLAIRAGNPARALQIYDSFGSAFEPTSLVEVNRVGLGGPETDADFDRSTARYQRHRDDYETLRLFDRAMALGEPGSAKAVWERSPRLREELEGWLVESILKTARNPQADIRTLGFQHALGIYVVPSNDGTYQITRRAPEVNARLGDFVRSNGIFGVFRIANNPSQTVRIPSPLVAPEVVELLQLREIIGHQVLSEIAPLKIDDMVIENVPVENVEGQTIQNFVEGEDIVALSGDDVRILNSPAMRRAHHEIQGRLRDRAEGSGLLNKLIALRDPQVDRLVERLLNDQRPYSSSFHVVKIKSTEPTEGDFLERLRHFAILDI